MTYTNNARVFFAIVPIVHVMFCVGWYSLGLYIGS